MFKAILFDLDGTLLSMDMAEFTKGYFGLLANKAATAGYERGKLIDTVWRGTREMIKNDGSMSNEARFWQTFAEVYGQAALADKRVFDEFYANEFGLAVSFTRPNPALAQQVVAAARSKAEKLILATNPVFPLVAIEERLSWLGLKTSDFDFASSYENSSFCKPNPEYYRQLLRLAGASPDEALMIGNDVAEDMEAAGKAGIRCYIVSDCVIGEPGGEEYASGALAQLPAWLKGL
ncbi:MAG: HAD family hydrolase [Clostridia bacterium]|nr:HAD family hydrolase [Clostridia bacterium]